MPRFVPPSITAAQAQSASVPSIYIGEIAKDETGVLWRGLPDGTWEKVGSQEDFTPFQLGTIGASVTLPLAERRSIEGTVGSTSSVAVSLPESAPVGTRSTVLLTASADCTIQLPTLYWLSPLGSVWNGVMTTGQSVRLSFVRSSVGWEAVDARLSTTAIPVVTDADEITVDQSGFQRIDGANAQTALQSADTALDALYDDLYGEVFDAGNITGAKTISFASARAVKATQTGIATITLTAPAVPKVCYLDINPGGFARSFATSIKWARGAVPSVPAVAGTSITYILRWTGSEWRGDAEYYAVPA